MIHRNELSVENGQLPPPANGVAFANAGHSMGNRGLSALAYLVEAADFARELGRDPWDFAVEIQTLREMGLTNNDLRWLVCKNLLEHRQETTTVGDTSRVFQPDRPLSFSENACFVISAAEPVTSRAGLDSLAKVYEAVRRSSPLGRNGHNRDLLPKWDRDRQELRVGGIVVKQFKVPAINQERILAAFEEEGWPVHIDDPLPPHPEQDPKRRLHDTINSLNRNQKRALIQFIGNGNGQGIRWELTRSRDGEGQVDRSA